MKMKSWLTTSIILSASFFIPLSAFAHEGTASSHAKEALPTTKHMANGTAEYVKDKSHEAWDATKKHTKKAYETTKDTASDVYDGTKESAHDGYHAIKNHVEGESE